MDTLLVSLLRTTLFLTVSGVVCYLFLRKTGDRMPRLSRFLWIAVLLSGWFWIRPAISIPWKETVREPEAVSVSEEELAPVFQEPTVRLPEGDVNSAVVFPESVTRPVVETKAFDGKFWTIATLFAAWLGGMVVSIFLAAAEYVRFLLLLRKTVPAGDDFAGPWRRLLEEHGIDARSVPMFVSDGRNNLGPAPVRTVWGYRLVVPNELWSELSKSGRCGILKHEREHFRRRDVWKSFFVRILALPHWFNPVAHLAVHRFEEAAELLCDRAAFECRREGVSEFAETLLLLHENAPTQFVARQSIFGRGLKHRVACLLHENQNDKGVSTMKKIFLIAGAVAILAACLFKVEFVEKTVAQEKKPIAEQKTGSDDSPSTPKIPLKASDRPDVRVYAVEKQVKDFPKTDDYSTPETAVASKIREGAEQYPKQIAEADQAEWTKEKRERNRKMAEEVAKSQWTSEILEVRVFKEKHAMALVHNGYWKYKPFSLWPMKKDGNAWSILPLERLETFEMFTAKFAEAIPRWEREDSGQWISPDGNRSTHLMVLAPQGDFKPRFMVEINYKLAPLWARANNDLSLGHMKTWPEDDKNGQKMLAVGICVNNSEAVREIVEKEIPEFSVLRIETLDEKTFKEYVMKKSRNINGQISWEDATQNTHVIVFTGKDDFKPKTPSEILVPISQAMRKMPVTDKPTAAGWTKSWVEDGRLVGALLTNDPERLEKMISDLTGHRVLRTEKLTDESLKEYQDRVSMGLPPETP